MRVVAKVTPTRVVRFWSSKFNRALVVLTLFLLAATVGIFWFARERNEELLVEQILHRQQVITRAGAGSIESFIGLVASFTSNLAIQLSSDDFEVEPQEALRIFLSSWDGTPVVGTILTNQEGIIVEGANNRGGTTNTGTDVSDRKYFKWAVQAKKGDVYVGEPILSRVGVSKGKHVITIVSPMIDEDGFKGAVTTGILLPDLTGQYLEPLKISEDTQVHLLNSEGNWLDPARHSESAGTNIIEYLEENPYPGSEELLKDLKLVLYEPDEVKLSTFPVIDGEITNASFLAAASPLDVNKEPGLENKHWFLVVATPKSDALKFSGTFYLSGSLGLVFALFVTLGILTTLMITVRVTQRNAYLSGFKQGKQYEKVRIKEKKK